MLELLTLENALKGAEGMKIPITEEMIDTVAEEVFIDPRLSAMDIAMRVNLSKPMVSKILKTRCLYMFQANTKWIPIRQTRVQKKERLDFAEKFLKLFEEEEPNNFLNSIVTGDETLILYYHVLPRRLNSGQLPTRKSILCPSIKKMLVTIFWDRQGILLIDFRKCNKISAEYYAYLLRKLRVAIRRKRPEVLSREVRLLHSDSSVHSAPIVKAAIRAYGFMEMKLPAFSPDLSPSEYYVFPKLKHHVKRLHFSNSQTLERTVLEYFENEAGDFFFNALNTLVPHCKMCIVRDGRNAENQKRHQLRRKKNQASASEQALGSSQNPLVVT